MGIRWRNLFALPIALLTADEVTASDRNIRKVWGDAPSLVGITVGKEYQNVVDAALESAARNIAVPSMSSAYTYRRNADGSYEQTSETFGPSLLVERPQTVGRGMWGVGVTGQYLEYDQFDGEKLGRDPHPLLGVRDEPVNFSATPHPIYHVGTLNVTYGILDDLDVNLVIPLVTTSFDYNTALRSGDGTILASATRHSRVDIGIGDIHLRGKYRLADCGRFAHAVLFDARMPTGDRDFGLGTGDGELGPSYALSTVIIENRVESTLNLGMDMNTTSVERSSGRWAVGMNVQAIHDWLDIALGVLGRHEVGERASLSSTSALHLTDEGPANTPYLGMRFDRKDYIDTSLSARVKLWKTLALSAGVLWAGNDDGLRSSTPSPIGSLEATF